MSKKSTEQKPEVATVALVQSAQEEEDTITIPVMDIFRQMKKYFLPWVLIAVIAAGAVFGGAMLLSNSKATPLTAMVGFTYDGIEKGLDPNGNEFDANTLKSPSIIESTLTDLGMDTKNTDAIRSAITISGVVPDDTIDELTAYKSIFESTNSVDAAQKLMDVSYYPTRFEIQFAYGNSEMNRSQAADFLNTMLSNYKTYFMRTYGYNDALGDALTAVDYTTYDYPQALDVFSSTLNSLQNYVSTLSQNDNTRFRSSDTGYTFADLNESINTLRSVDYATLQYRIDNLNRNLSSANEKLATITDSIKNYQKDSMVVMAGADATSSSALTQPSEAYDDLISQKTDAQSSVSSYQQQITDYQSRLDKLNSSAVASKKDQEKVETDMKTVCDKLNKLIDDVNATADDYFETASYANSYSVLVPASGSVSNAVSNAVSNMMRPLLIAEALLFVCYLVFAIVRAFIVSYRRNAIATAAVEAEERKEAAEAAEKTEETEE